MIKRILILVVIFLFGPFFVSAATKFDGKIVLNKADQGDVWYVGPASSRRIDLRDPAVAFENIRNAAKEIDDVDLQVIAQTDMPVAGDRNAAKKNAGWFVSSAGQPDRYWYIHPVLLKKILVSGPQDIPSLIVRSKYGVTPDEMYRLKLKEPVAKNEGLSRYSRQTIASEAGRFACDIVKIDLNNPDLKIITTAATPHPDIELGKERKHGARSLADYVASASAFAGMNGSYFESNDQKRLNYYFYPVYDTLSGRLINENELKYWTTGPVMAFDVNNKFYYFKDARDFKAAAYNDALAGWQIKNASTTSVKLAAAIGNKPRLIENGMNQLIDWEVDKKQRTVKTTRNAIGYKDGQIYLVVSQRSTVPDLASVMKALKMEYAINLDGGYSTALIHNNEYKAGPGRLVANAILFVKK